MGQLVDRDQEHLRILMWAYYGMAGFIGLFSLFGLIYVVLGGLMLSGAFPESNNSQGDPRMVGAIFAGIGGAVIVFGLIIAFVTYFTGRSIRDRHGRTFCLVVAGLSCLHIPWGTALGVCTINVLNRESVRALFVPTGTPPPVQAAPADA
jgi:hypothetical protein